MEDGKSHSQELSPHIPAWKNYFGGVTSFPHPAGYSRCSHMEQLRFPGRQRGAQALVGVENSSRRTMGAIPGKESQPDLQELLKSRVSLPALFLEFSWSHSQPFPVKPCHREEGLEKPWDGNVAPIPSWSSICCF